MPVFYTQVMSWTVIAHPEVDEWRASLDDDSRRQVFYAVRLLREEGPALGRPFADTVKASRHRNMKELRPGSGGATELRILFAFDPQRQAILLVAGDKTGKWQKWYKRAIPLADDRFDEHLGRQR